MNELEAKRPPIVLFTTRTNTELGAEAVRFENGEVVFTQILKRVNDAMLSSYPRTMLGKWTPNRASLRYREDEMSDHSVRSFESGEPLDLDGLRALAG